MHGACDYTVIHQGKIATGPSGTFEDPIPFTVAANAVLNVHSILAFTVAVLGGPPHLEIVINGHSVVTYRLPDGHFGTLVKVIGGGVLQHGTNQLHFHLTTPDAVSVVVEDLALWWFKDSLG